MGVEFGSVVRCDADGCRTALPLAAGEDAFFVVSAEDRWTWSRSFGYLCPDHTETGFYSRITSSTRSPRTNNRPLRSGRLLFWWP
jgi:hypothetical protein